MVLKELRLGGKILLTQLLGSLVIMVIMVFIFLAAMFLFDTNPRSSLLFISIVNVTLIPIYVYTLGYVANKFGWN